MIDNPINKTADLNADWQSKGFKVYQIETDRTVKTYSRKDFYKICMVSGKSQIDYADRGILIEGTTLFFGTPHIPYSWEIITEEQTGFTCLFTEDFLKGHERSESLQESPLFKIGGTPIFNLEQQQRDFTASIFEKMIDEQNTEYIFKQDLFRNYIHLLIHEALKLQQTENFLRPKTGSSRIAALFIELLERQFPIEDRRKPLGLRTAQDFANSLSVHVNHLNRSIKEVTGKPTTLHIAERIVTEAKALLQYTDWNVSEIAYALGFDYPTYFNNFFKKMTGIVPTAMRLQNV